MASGAWVDEDFGTVDEVSQLIVDEEGLGGRILTRIARYPEPILVHASLAKRLEDEGITGIRLKPLGEYTGFDGL